MCLRSTTFDVETQLPTSITQQTFSDALTSQIYVEFLPVTACRLLKAGDVCSTTYVRVLEVDSGAKGDFNDLMSVTIIM